MDQQELISKIEKTKSKNKKNFTTRKLIKGSTLLMGLVLIIFSTLSNVLLNFGKINWIEWITNTAILVGIMIFGLFMGESISADKQKEKIEYGLDEKGKTIVVGGLYQKNLKAYNSIRAEIEPIVLFFAQFYLWFKEKELRTKKIDFLIDNQFDGQWARAIVDHITKIDLPYLKSNNEHDLVYMKENFAIKKVASDEDIDIIKQMLEIKLDAPAYAEYLSAFGETGKKHKSELINHYKKKIKTEKRYNRGLKIGVSLVVSLIMGALTVSELAEGQQLQAWLNLISRLTAFITSFVSGWCSSVIVVKDEAEIIEIKTDVLNNFKDAINSKLFVPEKYEEQLARLLKEQTDYEEEHKVDIEVIDTPQLECQTPIESDILNKHE